METLIQSSNPGETMVRRISYLKPWSRKQKDQNHETRWPDSGVPIVNSKRCLFHHNTHDIMASLDSAIYGVGHVKTYNFWGRNKTETKVDKMVSWCTFTLQSGRSS